MNSLFKYFFALLIFTSTVSIGQYKIQTNVIFQPIGITNSNATLVDVLPRKDRFDIRNETTFGMEANAMLVKDN